MFLKISKMWCAETNLLTLGTCAKNGCHVADLIKSFHSKFFPILTVRGASYRFKGKIYSACVQSVLIYGTETWAMKADDMKSLKGQNV